MSVGLLVTRGIQKVCRPTQLTTIYADRILWLYNSLLQLKCTWSSISPNLWFHCRRIVLGLPASYLQCNTNKNGKYGGWLSSSKPKFQWLRWRVIRYVVLATSDFYFSSTERIREKKHKVSDDENVICTANGWLEDQEQQFFYNGMRTLEKPWTKCISIAGEYVEKWQNTICVSGC